MTEQQYRRANRTVFPIIICILGYFVLTLAAHILSAGATAGTLLQLIPAVLGIVGAVVVLVKWSHKKRGTIILMLCMTVPYVFIALFNQTETAFIYAFPILFTSMAFYNVRLVCWGNAVIVVSNLMRIIVNFDISSHAFLTNAFVGMFTIILAAIGSIRVVQLLLKFNKENIEQIQDAAKLQEEANIKMTDIAENIIKQFHDAADNLKELKESVDANNFAMSNIAESTESTAEAIQEQAVMCSEIQRGTDIAENEIKSMMEASDRTVKMVAEGSEEVIELKEQARDVKEASETMVAVIEALTEKAKQVEEFVGAILQISSQTNLLALNASIEAARAGEAGRGFAVVAEEIRQLSEQTEEASNHITDIIHKLNVDINRANTSISTSVTSIMKQNEMIERTGQKFEQVDKTVEELLVNIRNTEQSVKEILNSTDVISDNITHLSATSEEVAASSIEGLKTSEGSVQNMKHCTNRLKEIYKLAQDLKETE